MIKKYLLTLILAMCISGPAIAAFPIPKTAYKISNLDKACQKAVEENKPIIFLYSDKETTCPLCTSASNDIFYSLDKMSIIVYAQHSDWNKIPSLVQGAINSPAAGKYIPISVVVNPQLDQVIDIIPYQRQNRIVLINDTKDKIKKYFGPRMGK